ncbi:Virulence plasmid protein pGP2-D [Chlamydia psittaci]|uniref:Virulence plasmid protein pGP2-D n=4 Tax=Chlamydia TaxID=810 RepID=GP2D_CHLPS|nr:Virulence plasmid protein pGP2-D [Chlamydia psittaci]Q46260.1 RecName: Full=Virulence plasmid protein pGP2-D [Chlamydia psittaci]AFS44570.1 putative virulence plasmid protein pGP2-D [Chlamydia psittaci 84/55]AFS44611.1 putative virulence plasmid protein pGP2-D [Chlamydia psittaci VS225]EPJ15091.1 putative virulence plasmid protein pGP2-D [Chlamydia psittaci 02DC15]EPJ19134.1 putative virulence plasmid protein pGP2-D [Chlamydia psittaci 02DC22]EPJ21681.1 putative virulence plasmid protein p
MVKSENQIIKSSLHLENQKFGRKPQLSEDLFELFPSICTESKIEVIGLDLQPSHYHALAAIQKLLTATNYRGNLEGSYLSRETNTFKFEGTIPRIKFTKSEYLEAYGVKKYKTSRNKNEFGGKEALIALEALYHLGNEPYLIVATRKRWNKGEEVVDRYQTFSPILRICEGWEGLTPKENKALDEEPFLNLISKKHKGFIIEPCPIIVDQIDSYFVLKPANMYQEIKLRFPNASKFTYTFIDWIVSTATRKKMNSSGSKEWPDKIEIGFENLSYTLRMNRYITSRNWKKIESAINRCIEIAIELKWLNKHERIQGKTISKKEVFYLNKSKFQQISTNKTIQSTTNKN